MRNVLQRLFRNIGQCGRRGRIDEWSLFGNLNHGVHRAHVQRQVQSRKMTNLKKYFFLLQGVETYGLHRHRVRSGRQVGKAVIARRVCDNFLGANQGRGGHRYQRPRHNGARGVLDGALQPTRRLLTISRLLQHRKG